jgi:Ca2+-binding RTX toxin-like protein
VAEFWSMAKFWVRAGSVDFHDAFLTRELAPVSDFAIMRNSTYNFRTNDVFGRLVDLGSYVDYLGNFFHPFGQLPAGTLTQYRIVSGSQISLQVTDAWVDMTAFLDRINAGDGDGMLRLLLAYSDTLIGGSFADVMAGYNGHDTLRGMSGNDKLNGMFGNDRIDGDRGDDRLTGGDGHDAFIFDATLGIGNVDRITDFRPKDDLIWLDHAKFTALPVGWLKAAAFHEGTEAEDRNDHIIYDRATGRLYYDANGSLQPDDQILFATLAGRPAITYADFFVT